MSVQIICQRCRQAFHMPHVIGNLCKPCFRLVQAEIAAEKSRSDMADDMVLGISSQSK